MKPQVNTVSGGREGQQLMVWDCGEHRKDCCSHQ